MNQNLNFDVLILIFLYLETDDIFRLSRVSKQFKECFNHLLESAKRLVIGKSEYSCVYRPHLRCEHHFIDLTTLFKPKTYEDEEIIEFYSVDTYERFETLIRRCRHIHCVQLKNCIVDSNLLAILKRNLSEISCLFLEDCYLYEPHKWEEHTPMGIKKLVFDNCLTLESDEDNQDQSLQIFAKLPSLRKLYIKFECSGFTHDDIGTDEIAIMNNIPSSIDWLSLERKMPLIETLMEEHFNVQRSQEFEEIGNRPLCDIRALLGTHQRESRFEEIQFTVQSNQLAYCQCDGQKADSTQRFDHFVVSISRLFGTEQNRNIQKY